MSTPVFLLSRLVPGSYAPCVASIPPDSLASFRSALQRVSYSDLRPHVADSIPAAIKAEVSIRGYNNVACVFIISGAELTARWLEDFQDAMEPAFLAAINSACTAGFSIVPEHMLMGIAPPPGWMPARTQAASPRRYFLAHALFCLEA